MSRPRVWLKRIFTFSLCFGLNAGALWAQTATLRGKVTDAQSREALPQANIQVTATGIRTGAVSNFDGEFEVASLTAGAYTVIVSYVGYEKKTFPNVILKAGEIYTLNVALNWSGIELNQVVVTASRRQEKALEAPAAITVLEAQQIRGRPVTTATDYLRGLPAVDIATNGIAQSNVVVRGFNNIFSGSLLSLVDNRYAAVPSLRLNAYNFLPITSDDIARIEVVSGPGAALYGPNSTNGVMHIITKSPFESAGTTISIGGGGRDFFNFGRHDAYNSNELNHPNGRVGGRNIYSASFRHARLFSDKVGFKISGQYYRGHDWEDYYGFLGLPVQIPRFRATATGLDTVSALALNQPDFNIQKISGEARLDIRFNGNSSLIFNSGYNRSNQIELTGIGPGQAEGWAYYYGQTRFNYKNLFLQGFVNASNSGETYALNTGQIIEDYSKVIVGQAQHSVNWGEPQRFTYGLDAIFTRPNTKGSINGRNEEEDNITELGVYLQSETKLSPKFDLVAAARLDDHSELEDPVFSPRAALVFKPQPNHTLRATYNRAFSTPTPNSLFLDVLLARQFLFDVRTRGVPTKTGYHFSYGANGRPQMISPFASSAAYVNSDYVDAMWPGVHSFLKIVANDPASLQQLPAPFNQLTPEIANLLVDILPSQLPANSVPGILKRIDLVRAQQPGAGDPFDLVDPSTVKDIGPIKPTITNNFEVGYKGIIGNKLLVTVDVYHSKIRDFVGPLKVETPTVHASQKELAAALTQQISADPAALQKLQQLGLSVDLFVALISGFLQNVPMGIVSPRELRSGTEITQTSRNFGEVTLNGMDVSVSCFLSPQWTLSSNYSFVTTKGFNPFKKRNRVFYYNLDGIANVALNAPGNKAALAVQYRTADHGFDTELRGRYVEGFPMESGAYAGEVQTYMVLDWNIGYDLPFSKSTRFSVNVQNLFDKKHLEFIGAPILGRLILTRLTQSF